MRSTFKHLFYINRSKTKKNGLCPVMARITLDSGIAQFSTGLETAPELWDAKAGLSKGKSLHELKVNREIKELSKAIEAHYARMVEQDGYVTAERVKNAVLGVGKEPTTLLKEFEEATEEVKKSVGINHSTATYKSYVNSYMNLSRFIKVKFKKEDIPFSQLEYSFIEDYDLYLKTEQRMATGSVLQHIVFLRKMVKRAMNKGIISRNPFFGYTPDQPVSKHKWLSSEEIERIMTTSITKPSVDFVRDMFVFGTFTNVALNKI